MPKTMTEKALQANRLNARKGSGRKRGVYRPPNYKVDLNAAVDQCAERILTGKFKAEGDTGSLMNPDDRRRIRDVLGVNLVEFNRMMSEKLARVSDKILARIEEKADDDAFKPGELGFVFSVMEDKRRALDAAAAGGGGSQVNIQINHYGDKTREEILADLDLAKNPQADPKDVI